jgi:hypothetical protein
MGAAFICTQKTGARKTTTRAELSTSSPAAGAGGGRGGALKRRLMVCDASYKIIVRWLCHRFG